MQRKKARTKLAKLFRKIGIEFVDAFKIAKQIVKEGWAIINPCIKIELKYLNMCGNDCCGPIFQGYKGPSGIVTVEQVYMILSQTR